jgi:hypothetical protein
MSIARTAVLSILVACWIAGLFNQFHSWNTTAAYLIISMLIVAVVVARRQYALQYAKNRRSHRQ